MCSNSKLNKWQITCQSFCGGCSKWYDDGWWWGSQYDLVFLVRWHIQLIFLLALGWVTGGGSTDDEVAAFDVEGRGSTDEELPDGSSSTGGCNNNVTCSNFRPHFKIMNDFIKYKY